MLQNTLLEFDMHVFDLRYSIKFCTHMLLNTEKFHLIQTLIGKAILSRIISIYSFKFHENEQCICYSAGRIRCM